MLHVGPEFDFYKFVLHLSTSFVFLHLCGNTFICILSSDEWNLEWQMKKKKKTTAQYKQLAPNNFLELLSENWRPIKYCKQSNTWILNVQLYYFFFYHADCKLISSDTHFLLTLNWIKSQFSCPAHSGRHLRLSTAKIDRRFSSLEVYRRCNTGEPKCILHHTPIFFKIKQNYLYPIVVVCMKDNDKENMQH